MKSFPLSGDDLRIAMREDRYDEYRASLARAMIASEIREAVDTAIANLK